MNRLPNILWITTDQQRFDTIHALGNEYINTPNLDRLCQEGVAFKKAYSQSPVCTPSRASFLTGLYPSTLHVNYNGNKTFPDDVELITKKLADIGYKCGLSGKLHIASAFEGVERRTDDGYTVFYYSHSPSQGIDKRNEYVDWIREQGAELEDVFVKKEKIVKGENETYYSNYSSDADPELHQTTWCAEKAIEFMKENQDNNWLFSVNIFDPHPPCDPPGIYREKYNPEELPEPIFSENDLKQQKNLKDAFFQQDAREPGKLEQINKAHYYGMIELIDKQVGRMMDVLEESGQRENTIVIFMSDHGEMLGDHGLSAKGCRFYEGAVHVPFIISWPDQFESGIVYDDIVELTDIAPTIAELTGIEFENNQGKPLAGKSLVPILIGEKMEERHREFVRCEYYNALNMYAPYHPEKNTLTYATMYYDGRYKLVVYHTLDTGELYDHKNDPEEINNLWDDPEAETFKMELMKKSFDQSIVINDPGSEQIGRY